MKPKIDWKKFHNEKPEHEQKVLIYLDEAYYVMTYDEHEQCFWKSSTVGKGIDKGVRICNQNLYWAELTPPQKQVTNF